MINPYAAIFAIGFALACGAVGYKQGANSVQVKWDKNIAEVNEAIARQNAANWEREKSLNASVNQLRNDYAKEKTARLAAAADLDRSLRDFQAANDPGQAGADAAAPGGTNGTGGLERELLNACAATLVGLAKTADRLEQKVVGLQDYIKALGLDK